jgi:UDP-glucose 4-epimerase
MLRVIDEKRERINIYNLGTDEACEVDDSIRWICEHLGLDPRIEYSGGTRGWVGDSPLILLDCTRIRSTGWAPNHSIRDSIIRTVDFLRASFERERQRLVS